MGILPEQGTPFIGKRTTFASAYPNVESAVVVYTETDFGDDPCKYVWNLAHDPRAACHNNLCYQGGYNFEWQLMQMVAQGTESSAVEMSCGGHEGTPKGRRRGRGCLMSIKGTMTIKYRKTEPVSAPARK